MQDLKFHELANIFPLLSGQQLQELADDIKANGLREQIVLYEGKILDGRNRYNALKLTGEDPTAHKCMLYCHDLYSNLDPIAFVISQNIHRRHLTTDQRAQIAAELYAKLPKKKEGRAPKQLSPIGDSNDLPSADSQKEKVATQMNVSTKKMERAAAIQNKDPQKAAEIKAGTKTIKEAEKEMKPAKPKKAPVVPKPDRYESEVVAMAEAGLTHTEIAEKIGRSARAVRQILDDGRLRREGVPEISRGDLSLSAQQKLDLAIKQHKQTLAVAFQEAVQKEVNTRIREYLEAVTPKLRAEQEEAQRIIKLRKGIMDIKTYKKIRDCLHPDRALHPARETDGGLKKAYEDATHIWANLKRLFLDEKTYPTPADAMSSPIPKTPEEWEAALRKAKQERKAKREERRNSAVTKK